MIVALYSYTSGSGKDTCADFIADWARMENRTFSRAAFANAMKVVCGAALGILGHPVDQIGVIDGLKLRGEIQAWEGDLCVSTQSGRDFIIGLAESIRRLDPEFWIRHTAASDAEVHVITDMRFIPEAEWVRAHGGVIVEIVRPGTTHRNEDSLAHTDHMILNNGSLESLQLEVCRIMDLIFPIR